MSFIKLSRSSHKTVIRIQNLKRATCRGIEYGGYVSGRGLVAATSADILRKPKKGRTYIRRDALGRKRRHVASAPGETHANMTGRLRRSLSFKVNRSEITFGYGVTRNDAPDHAAIEFGTKNIKARPSLRNNIAAERRNIVNNLEREIKRQLT